MRGRGRALCTAGAGLHVLVGSCMDLGFYVHRERRVPCKRGPCVCVWSPLCVQVPYVPVQSLSTGVCYMCVGVPVRGRDWRGEVSLGVQWVSYTRVGVPDTCGHQSVRGWGCPGVVGGTLCSQAPRARPAQGSAPPSRSHLLHLPPPTRRQGQKHRPRVGLARFLATSRNPESPRLPGRGSRVRLRALLSLRRTDGFPGDAGPRSRGSQRSPGVPGRGPEGGAAGGPHEGPGSGGSGRVAEEFGHASGWGPPRSQVLPGQAGAGGGGRGGGGRVNQAARRAGRGREWLPDRLTAKPLGGGRLRLPFVLETAHLAR